MTADTPAPPAQAPTGVQDLRLGPGERPRSEPVSLLDDLASQAPTGEVLADRLDQLATDIEHYGWQTITDYPEAAEFRQAAALLRTPTATSGATREAVAQVINPLAFAEDHWAAGFAFVSFQREAAEKALKQADRVLALLQPEPRP